MVAIQSEESVQFISSKKKPNKPNKDADNSVRFIRAENSLEISSGNYGSHNLLQSVLYKVTSVITVSGIFYLHNNNIIIAFEFIISNFTLAEKKNIYNC